VVVSTGQCYSHSHYHRRSDGRTVCDMRRARWGKVVNSGRIGRTTCFREQLPRCVWEAEGGADTRAGGRATAPPSSPRCLSATTPPPPPRGGNSQGPCQEPEDGRTDRRCTRRRSLIAGEGGRWTAHEDDAATRLFATNILQLLTLTFKRDLAILS